MPVGAGCPKGRSGLGALFLVLVYPLGLLGKQKNEQKQPDYCIISSFTEFQW